MYAKAGPGASAGVAEAQNKLEEMLLLPASLIKKGHSNMKEKVSLLLIAFFIAGLSMAFGQPQDAKSPELRSKKSQNTLGLSLGLHHSQNQDLLFSPLTYDGQSLLAIELFYQRRSQKGLHLLRVAFDRMSVESTGPLTFPFFDAPITRQSSTASFLNLKYGYAREAMHNEKMNLLIGGMLDNQIHLLEYKFAEYEEEGYLLAYSLAIWLRGEFRINQTQSLNFETSFPLVYFLSRPPYAIVDNEGIQSNNGFTHVHGRGKLHALSGFTKLQLLLSYNRSLSSKLDLLLAYQFDYIRATEPLKLSVVKNGFDLGVAFKF